MQMTSHCTKYHTGNTFLKYISTFKMQSFQDLWFESGFTESKSDLSSWCLYTLQLLER